MAQFLGFPTEVKVNKKRLQETVLGAVVFVLLIRGCGWLAERADGPGTAGAGTVVAGAGSSGQVAVDARTGEVRQVAETAESAKAEETGPLMTPDEAEQKLEQLLALYRELVAHRDDARVKNEAWNRFLRSWNPRFTPVLEDLQERHARSGMRSALLNLVRGLASQIKAIQLELIFKSKVDQDMLEFVGELERDIRETIQRCRTEVPMPVGC